jgi:hypothetical protein
LVRAQNLPQEAFPPRPGAELIEEQSMDMMAAPMTEQDLVERRRYGDGAAFRVLAPP